MSDERMREQFEKWLVERGLTDEVWLQDPYTSWSIDDMYDVYRARDAEVQALRAVNNQLHRMVSFFASSIKSGEQWSAYHEEEMTALRAAHKEAADAD